MNMAGVRGSGRLEQVFAAARRERVDAFMGQEHGLHACDEERLHMIAHDHGFRVEMSPVPSGTTRGGTWVALSMNTFRLTRADPIPRNRETLGGGVTAVRVPMERVCGEGAQELELQACTSPSMPSSVERS